MAKTPEKDKWDGHFEFGGVPGVLAFIIGSHIIVYYFYLCLEFHGGSLVLPYTGMFNLLLTHAMPTWETVTVYSAFTAFEVLCALVMPGVITQGLPLPSEGGAKLDYNCNALACWYSVLLATLVLSVTGVYPIYRLRESYGAFLTTAVITGNLVSVIIYVWGILSKNAIRMSGNHIYDFFMGSYLNPRLFGGRIDLKMFAEIRNSWALLFLVTVSCAAKQYKEHGFITLSMAFMVLAHLLYANACAKGEECIPTTWDMYYEKFGWMLIWWNFAGVPFTYCFQSVFVQTVLGSAEGLGSTLAIGVAYGVLLGAYYVWDTSNSQKNRFRMSRQGVPKDIIYRKAFPQFAWGTLKNPKTIKGPNGLELLADGWWGKARKIHYTADLTMSFLWGAICGFRHFIPFFYFCFFLPFLTHRAKRDSERCVKKYGPVWEEFVRTVPYTFIPGII